MHEKNHAADSELDALIAQRDSDENAVLDAAHAAVLAEDAAAAAAELPPLWYADASRSTITDGAGRFIPCCASNHDYQTILARDAPIADPPK